MMTLEELPLNPLVSSCSGKETNTKCSSRECTHGPNCPQFIFSPQKSIHIIKLFVLGHTQLTFDRFFRILLSI